MEAGENHVDALVRELAEEIGLTVTPAQAIGPVWTRNVLFCWHGRLERHLEQFFLVRVGSHEVDTSAMDAGEQSVVHAHRWWSVDEIRRSQEPFAPHRLARLLAPLIAGEIPLTPLDAGV